MTDVATAISSRLEAKFAAELGAVDSVALTRRCADVAELLAAAEAGAMDLAAISPDFPGMSGSVIAELALLGVGAVGVVSPTSPTDARQCESWALTHVHLVGSGELAGTLAAHRAGGGELPGAGEPSPLTRSPSWTATPTPDAASENEEWAEVSGAAESSCCTVVVWGTAGAPGRTTCAVHLAHALARCGTTLLVDADTVAPSVAGALGILDEAPGVLAAARLVDAGSLTPGQLTDVVTRVDEGYDVLTGIGRASRWQELTRFHVGEILARAEQQYRFVVVDVAADLEADEALLYDTAMPTRCAAGLEAIARADVVLAVAGCDPISLQRFVVDWQRISELHEDVRPVVTKARQRAVGGPPETVVTAAMERFVGVRPVVVLPDIRDALDDALLRGGSVVDHAANGAFAAGMRTLAVSLGAPVASTAGRRLRRRRRHR